LGLTNALSQADINISPPEINNNIKNNNDENPINIKNNENNVKKEEFISINTSSINSLAS